MEMKALPTRRLHNIRRRLRVAQQALVADGARLPRQRAPWVHWYLALGQQTAHLDERREGKQLLLQRLKASDQADDHDQQDEAHYGHGLKQEGNVAQHHQHLAGDVDAEVFSTRGRPGMCDVDYVRTRVSPKAHKEQARRHHGPLGQQHVRRHPPRRNTDEMMTNSTNRRTTAKFPVPPVTEPNTVSTRAWAT
jgi:hypothetical protein